MFDLPQPFGPTMAVTPASKRSEEHTSELQSQSNLVCRLLLEKKKEPLHARDLRRGAAASAGRSVLCHSLPARASPDVGPSALLDSGRARLGARAWWHWLSQLQ